LCIVSKEKAKPQDYFSSSLRNFEKLIDTLSAFAAQEVLQSILVYHFEELLTELLE